MSINSRVVNHAATMIKFLLLLVFLITCLNLAHLASFLPEKRPQAQSIVIDSNRQPHIDDITTTRSAPTSNLPNISPNLQQNPATQASSSTTQLAPTTITSTTEPTNTNADSDLDDLGLNPTTTSLNIVTIRENNNQNSQVPNNSKVVNLSKPLTGPFPVLSTNSNSNLDNRSSTEIHVLYYSIFIVYVSFIKLIYHNVDLIKRNLTEPGILMIFGMIWELVAKQINTEYDPSPKFNSRFFFYLFLPSTVLEAGSLLSNKWLFLNLLPILIHSIMGTLLYASALGFSIYSLSRQNAFSNGPVSLQNTSKVAQTSSSATGSMAVYHMNFSMDPSLFRANEIGDHKLAYQMSGSSEAMQTQSNQQLAANLAEGANSNLTLAECLMFGTILSSIDSSTMLNIFKQLQMNDKLYYLVLGESLLNNAVVIVLFDLLLDFLNEFRLTVVKIYFAIIQFFITLFGSIFIGLILAIVALTSVRLTKRFQVASALTSYQNQCQAMVETLLVLKLAYLTYTLAALAGTSSIVSLATFGILQDQYIKHNLNLRSQLTFKQVVLATRTLGFSLVYPLLGMLLVNVADTSQILQTFLSTDGNQQQVKQLTSTIANQQLSSLPNKLISQSHYWNIKFLSLVIILTLLYRFLIVVLLSLFCNLFTTSQLRIKMKEQVLVSYGGFKGPLAYALVHRLIEHEEFRDNKTMRNKHLFMYTILFITFISTIVKGCFIRALVTKMQLVLNGQNGDSSMATSGEPIQTSAPITIVFDEINCKVTEYLSDGLNSIIGHTKSPYNKFLELNESTIKPWLSRDESNTNWLSVFYDNLILDETLNANCFYRSAEQIAYYLNNRRKSDQNEDDVRINQLKLERKDRGRRRSVSNKAVIAMDTIDENKLLNQTADVLHKTSFRSPPTTTAQLVELYRSSFKEDPRRDEKEILKEFVMLNLKLDDANKRKRSALGTKSAKVKPEAVQLKIEHQEPSTSEFVHRPVRMLSSTSSEDFNSYKMAMDKEIRQHSKQHRLANLEKNINLATEKVQVIANESTKIPGIKEKPALTDQTTFKSVRKRHNTSLKRASSRNVEARQIPVRTRRPNNRPPQKQVKKGNEAGEYDKDNLD